MAIDLNALLALVQPDPEYCLFGWNTWATCMKKSEWASWVQAVGSIAAVGAGAVGIWWQVREQRIHQARLPLLAEIAALDEATELLSTASDTTAHLVVAAQRPGAYATHLLGDTHIEEHKQMSELLDAFDAGKLPTARLKLEYRFGVAAFGDLLYVQNEGRRQQTVMCEIIADQHRARYEASHRRLQGQADKLRQAAKSRRLELDALR